MPLIKGTSQKSFVKNLKTEMHHGHPQKQALAIAYSMKRKAEASRHKAHGGVMGAMPESHAMADGGQMDSCPNCGYAHGGSVKGVHQSDMEVERPDTMSKYGHSEKRWAGESEAGSAARLYQEGMGDSYKDKAMQKHGEVIAGIMGIKPKLKGLAHGGLTGEGDEGDPQGFHDEEDASGYHMEPENHVEHNEMAMHEDDKDLNQHMPHDEEDPEDDMVGRIMHKRSKSFEGEARLAHGGEAEEPFEYEFEQPNDFEVEPEGDEYHYSGANSGDEIGDEREDDDREDIVSRIMRSRKKRDRMPSPA